MMGVLGDIFDFPIDHDGFLGDGVIDPHAPHGEPESGDEAAQAREARFRKAASSHKTIAQSPKDVTFKTSMGEIKISRKDLRLTDGHFAESVFMALKEKHAAGTAATPPAPKRRDL